VEGDLISVVIPVFNRPDTVARAIGSVQAQRGLGAKDIEIILVDDGSVPPLRVTVADARTKIVRCERNMGAAAARNLGVRAAKGDYLAFLDSDDVWRSDKLACQLDVMRRIEQENGATLDALVCNFYCPNRVTGRLQSRMLRSANTLSDFASGCWFCPGSTLFIRRSAFNSVGPFDERLRRLEDLDWFIRFGQRSGHLHVLPYVGVIVAPSYSGSFDAVDQSTRVIEAKFNACSDTALPPSAWRRLQAYLALERGAALLREGETLKGLCYLLFSFWHKPRLQAAVKPFWERCSDVPPDVLMMFAEMAGRV
jgi:glycosyltransferase involved in cell wall biosynthesis